MKERRWEFSAGSAYGCVCHEHFSMLEAWMASCIGLMK